jgi:Tol biopolymer transport system component
VSKRFDDVTSSTQSLRKRLSSWKEIATYFDRDVTTVQRWEKREGMPVYRHLHDRMGSVYAFPPELDAWAQSRNLKASQESTSGDSLPDPGATPEPTPQHSGRRWSLLSRALALAAVGVALTIGASLWFRRMDFFWRSPLEGARFETVTDFDGVARDAALSRDGHFVAFLSDHDGPMDIWVSQVGSGQFHNLTHGSAAGVELVNPFVRTLGFSTDSSVVTFWTRKQGGSNGDGISIWSIPTLDGQPRPYLEGVAEFDWSHDGSRLAYHEPGPGDPLFVSDGLKRSKTAPIFTAHTGLHSHFPLWSPDSAFLYLVQGSLPDKLDIWRIPAKGGEAERITSHPDELSYLVLINNRMLIYLGGDADGSGSRLYGMDVKRRVPHVLTYGPERYTSLAASGDGQRLAVTLANPKTTLWRLPIGDPVTPASAPTPIALTTNAGFFPRYGPNYLIYVSRTGEGDGIWKLANGIGTELWSVPGSRVLAAPVTSPDGNSIAFSIRQNNQSQLYVMHADGTHTHVIADSLDLQGAPAWARDGRSLASSVNKHGIPQVVLFPLDGGGSVSFVKEYSVNPVWAPDGRFVLYSGADIGTTFSIKAVNSDGAPHPIPSITLTRGARHAVFALGGRELVLLRGQIEHKDLWSIDLRTGIQRQLTKLPADFNIREFDLSPDGREVVLERVQERSEIVLLELARH